MLPQAELTMAIDWHNLVREFITGETQRLEENNWFIWLAIIYFLLTPSTKFLILCLALEFVQ